MNQNTRDEGIPILTEVIEADAAAPPKAAPEPPATDVFEQGMEELFEPEMLARLNDEDFRRLERKIRERILRQILARADASLEQKIRDGLADAMQVALHNLTEEIHVGLHRNLEEVITRAVSQEVTRLQSMRK